MYSNFGFVHFVILVVYIFQTAKVNSHIQRGVFLPPSISIIQEKYDFCQCHHSHTNVRLLKADYLLRKCSSLASCPTKQKHFRHFEYDISDRLNEIRSGNLRLISLCARFTWILKKNGRNLQFYGAIVFIW